MRYFGVEIEFILFDLQESSPCNSNDYIEDLLSEIQDERVYRDYFPHQIEIRTYPSTSAEDLEKQIHTLFANALSVALKYDFIIIPKSILEMYQDYMFTGTHIHITDTRKTLKLLYSELVNYKYPLLLALYPYFSTSKVIRGTKITNFGLRLTQSPHIGINEIPANPDAFYEDYTNNMRYRDIAINRNEREGRHRIKDVDTVEIRFFDTILLDIAILIEAIKKILDMPTNQDMRNIVNSIFFNTVDRYIMKLERFRNFDLILSGTRAIIPVYNITVNSMDSLLNIPEIKKALKNTMKYHVITKERYIDLISKLRINASEKKSLISKIRDKVKDTFAVV